jgi:peroxiredoxin
MRSIAPLFLLFAITVSIAAQTKPTTGAASRYDFAATAMDGSKVDTASLRGKVVVFNLWFINCPNCIEELKLLNQLVTDYAGRSDVVFIAPAASRRPDVEKFLKKNPFKYIVVPDAAQIILTRFGTPNKKGEIDMPFPMHFVLDRTGKVVVQAQGVKGVDAVKKELAKQSVSAPVPAAN